MFRAELLNKRRVVRLASSEFHSVSGRRPVLSDHCNRPLPESTLLVVPRSGALRRELSYAARARDVGERVGR